MWTKVLPVALFFVLLYVFVTRRHNYGLDHSPTTPLSHPSAALPTRFPSILRKEEEEGHLQQTTPSKTSHLVSDSPPPPQDLANVNMSAICLGWCPPKVSKLNIMARELDCDRHMVDQRLRAALQLENCFAAVQSPENAVLVREKLRKLANNDVFVFFRGAAGFFDLELMCHNQFQHALKNMPLVVSNGDAHPENFGTMVMANGGLVFGVNDFDQSFNTPFSWDLKRGATGTQLACLARGWNEDVCRQSVNGFVQSYVGIAANFQRNVTITNNDRFLENSKASNARPLMTALFERARKSETDEEILRWLERDLNVDSSKDVFFKTEFTDPLPASENKKFQAALDAYLYHGVPALMIYPPGEFWKVLSVARRYGKGTGSVGLNRYFVLLRGKKSSYGGRVVLEMKQETHSLLEMFFRYKYTAREQGKRAVDAERGAYPYTNPFYGWTNIDDHAYIVRERSKHEKQIKMEYLTANQYLEYSQICGRALAMYHFKMCCATVECKLDDPISVDYETWEGVNRYIRDFGVSNFRNNITKMVYEESQTQLTGWGDLRLSVTQMEMNQEDPLGLLNFKLPGADHHLCE